MAKGGCHFEEHSFQMSKYQERVFSDDACVFCIMGQRFFKKGAEFTEMMRIAH